jgi:hypothetical protein
MAVFRVKETQWTLGFDPVLGPILRWTGLVFVGPTIHDYRPFASLYQLPADWVCNTDATATLVQGIGPPTVAVHPLPDASTDRVTSSGRKRVTTLGQQRSVTF